MEKHHDPKISSMLSNRNTDITAGSVEKAQEKIYSFFQKILKFYRHEVILNQFSLLFIKYEEINNIEPYDALGEIIFHNKEDEFKNTLLRCCYILNNNWAINGNIDACRQLVDLFLADSIGIPTKITKLRILRLWLQRFIQSDEYTTLRLLSGRAGIHKNYHNWADRFSSYLLTSEYSDLSNSEEHRQYAETLSRKLKKKFKFDLALYTARLDSKSGANAQLKNPTSLGDGVLILVKKILNSQRNLNFKNNAQKFYDEAYSMSFLEFKNNFLVYIGLSKDSLDISSHIRLSITQKLISLHNSCNHEKLTIGLLHITFNRVLQLLLLNEFRQPSEFIKLTLSRNNNLSSVILLLKIVLVFPNSRLYLENHVADLIKFYSSHDEDECRDFITFLDVLNVTLTIFDNDTDYSLIKMRNVEDKLAELSLENYRIFSQSKPLQSPAKVKVFGSDQEARKISTNRSPSLT